MKPDDLGKRMRSQEYFRSLRLLPGTWTVIRVDGRGFRRYTSKRFNKPFDSRFRDLMKKTAIRFPKRTPVSTRYQFQRTAPLAAAWNRIVLGAVY
jgi:tRNA(His) 5'-end guanylyltransferase